MNLANLKQLNGTDTQISHLNTQTKTPIVVFAEDWGQHPSSTQHLIKCLLADRQIVWVNSLGLRRPRLTLRDGQRLLSKLRALFKSKKTSPSIEKNQPLLINPLAIPWPGNALCRIINKFLLSKQINQVLRQLNIEKPLLWLSLPTAVDMIGVFNESASIYYCGDNFSALAGVDHDAVEKLEQELINKADLILTASSALCDKFSPIKSVCLPHGVDAEHFAKAQSRPLDLPSDKPIAGFYGSISEWIDIDLIYDTAKRLKHWNFIFIGPVQTNIKKLQSLDNIFFLGVKAHHQLPAYVQHWQVSLLPFIDNEQIRACNPLKLREYLAVGTPIVTTDFPALDGYRHLIQVVNGSIDFSNAILSSLTEKSIPIASDLYHKRKQCAQSESWYKRSLQLEQLIGTL
jgi:glycosyltransferase involved in cell wall biosynthesis